MVSWKTNAFRVSVKDVDDLFITYILTNDIEASVMTSEQENTRLRVEMLEKLLTKTMEENAKLYDENMSLRKHLAQ